MKKVTPRKAFSKFRPNIVSFILSYDLKNKRPSGMIASWCMKCSFEPPLLVVSLKKVGYTHRLINESKEFVVVVANKSLEKEVNFFGTTHGDKTDKFNETQIKITKSKHLNVPLLKNANNPKNLNLYH
ncbi:MAG: flavin reductase [Nanoarchaeota archaeon]|nr:flavin reductase [Nanoarchaeota archaeon]